MEKAFCALKKKQLEVALGKVEEARVQVMADIKKSDECEDKLCALHVEGFDLVYAYVKKHHPEIDLSTLDIEEVEREVVTDWAATAQANDVVHEKAKASIDDPIGLVDPAKP